MDDVVFKETPRWRYWWNNKDYAWYWLKALFKPYNVIKIQALPRMYRDRTETLFHAAFQVLVDYVELEQYLVPWGQQCKGRFYDQHVMRNCIQERWGNDPYSEMSYESNQRALTIYKQVLDLYSWYKSIDWSAATTDDDDLEQVCEEQLLELVKLRRYLWS